MEQKFCEWCGDELRPHDLPCDCWKEVGGAKDYCPRCGDFIAEDAVVCSCDKQD